MLDINKTRLALDPDRPLTDAEREYYAHWWPSLDLPPTITAPTRSGGILKLISDGPMVTLDADCVGPHRFTMRFTASNFKNLVYGDIMIMPGVGRLVATPRGRDRIRLVLLPERKGSECSRGGEFEVDLRLSEIMTKL